MGNLSYIVILRYVVVSVVISFIFGATISSSLLIKKAFKKDFISPYLFQFWSLVFFIMILSYFKPSIQILNIYSLWNWKNVLLFFLAVFPTSAITYQGNKLKPTNPMKVDDFFKGASMEIPQRLLVQNLFVILGVNMVIYGSLTLDVFLNSLIWIQFIIVQKIINGNKISLSVAPEIIASFWFSIWVGILYNETGNIVIPMMAHGLQRIITYKIRQKFGKQNLSETKI